MRPYYRDEETDLSRVGGKAVMEDRIRREWEAESAASKVEVVTAAEVMDNAVYAISDIYDGVFAEMPYAEFLKSDYWWLTRQDCISAAGYRCQRCGLERVPFNVHHLTYERRGHEAPGDLVVLCRRCHEKAHGLDGSKPEDAE